jgi:hypothetical protein
MRKTKSTKGRTPMTARRNRNPDDPNDVETTEESGELAAAAGENENDPAYEASRGTRAGQHDNTSRENRGAGSGEHANATRGRDSTKYPDARPGETPEKHIVPTQYEKGQIDKGRIDFEALAECDTATDIAMRDRRAYLINQANLNEAANDELNALQVAGHRRLHEATAFLNDPDWQRENSMETAIAALEMHDPEKLLATRAERQENRKLRRIEIRAQQRPTMIVPNPNAPGAETPAD